MNRWHEFNELYGIEDAEEEAEYADFNADFKGQNWTKILQYFPDDDDEFDDTYW